MAPPAHLIGSGMQKETALTFLRWMLNSNAEFCEGQWEAIDAAANRRERLLVVQRNRVGSAERDLFSPG